MATARPKARPPIVGAAVWSVRLASFALALAACALILHRAFGLSTPVLMNSIAVAFALAALAVFFAILAAAVIFWKGRPGFGVAVGGLLLALLLLAWPAAYMPMILAAPPLNDVTTDTEQPPEFIAAAEQRPRGANSVSYRGVIASRVQASLYPDIQPIVVDRPPAEAFDLAAQAIRRLGYRIIAEDEPSPTSPGRIEAVARTLVIGFEDDVVIRVVGQGALARIDIRSQSRWGEHDFGANAQRVREIVRAILSRMQATVPGRRGA